MFRVTRAYLNLLVKPRIFSGFLKIYIILCILKGEMPFKMHTIIFLQKKMLYVCLPYLIFSDPLHETPLFFYLAYTVLNNTTLPYVLTKINVQINCDLMIIYFKDLVLICTQWNLHKLFKHYTFKWKRYQQFQI